MSTNTQPFSIIVTGASRGLGAAMAEAFAADGQGHTLLLVARQPEALADFATKLQASYPNCTVLHHAADLADRKALELLGQSIPSLLGRVDVLINNAGSFIPGSVHSEPEGALETMLQTNLMSAYHLTRAVLPLMIAAQSGHIFNICSIAGLKAYDNGGSYSISKWAMRGFGENLRAEMKPHNIKVTNVHPGAVYTDSWAGSGIDPQRIMLPSDIARLVYATSFLSPQACVEELVIRPQLGDL